jgi:serine/threonine-protein kinase
VSSTSRIGSTLGGYRLDDVLGRGGMSVVYVAEHVRLGRKVALKLLSPALGADDTFRRRFQDEARRAAAIDHPGIVPVYDAGDEDGQLYIAMRLVEGCDLGDLVEREGQLDLPLTLSILAQAAGALDAAHAHALVHRDVKPGNILLETASGRAFVTDFGIAKHTSAGGATRTGFFIGTVDYAAPEQIEGREVDGRTDVYALGCVLFECLTGTAPYERDSEVAVMHAHLTQPPPTLSTVRPDVPPALDLVIAKALAKSPDDRYTSCGELIAAAGEAGGVAVAHVDLGDVEPAAPRASTARARTARSRLVLFAASTALLLVGAAVATALVVGDDETPAASTETSAAGSGLELVVPEELWRDCVLNASPRAGALATASCTPQPASGSPAGWEVSLFPGEAYDGYTAVFESLGIVADEGDCSALAWSGEGEWRHPTGRLGGRRLCYVDGADAVLAWTHERRQQPDHASVLGVARAPAREQAALYAWWTSWRDRIGVASA